MGVKYQTMSENNELIHKAYVNELINRARIAQKTANDFSQKKVDQLCEAVAYACTRREFREKAARILAEESQMGNEQDKQQKLWNKITSVYSEMKGQLSVGEIARDEEKKLVIYAKPMGVVSAVIPVTNGESTPIIKTLWALKTRNALILSPHHRGRKTADYIVNYIRKVLEAFDAPPDLLQFIDEEHSGRDTVSELMGQSDFVVATGGKGLVHAAYSSGTPAIGVGAGNCTVYVDITADIEQLARQLNQSQSFDNSSSCSSESNLLVHTDIYEKVIAECEKHGAYVIKRKQEEKQKLIQTIWPNWPENNQMSRKTPAQNALKLAELSGFKVPSSTTYLLLEEDQFTKVPVSAGEKLCPVLTIFRVEDFVQAQNIMEDILSYQGSGHSCGIYTKQNAQAEQLAERMKVSRILVNQPHSSGNGGAWFNGLASTNTLGCGTWGGNSSSQNITWKDLLNTTTLSYRLDGKEQTWEEDVFSKEMQDIFAHIDLNIGK